MSDSKERLKPRERMAPARKENSGGDRGGPPRKPPRGGSGGGGGRGGRGPRKRRSFGGFLAGFLVGGLYKLVVFGTVAALLVVGIGFFVMSRGLPSVDSLKNYKPPLASRVYADNFQLVSELASERRVYVPYADIPPVVADAFISAEDRNFWIDPGIDPEAILRAGFVDLTRIGSDRRPLGASTITQQVVKNMLLDNRITFARKIKEAILAMRVSRVMSKKQILELYLNEIYLGNNTYGVAAAAQAYFDKPLSQLDIAEAASLGALPKAPTTYDPFRNPALALARRNWVISRMLADHDITAAQAKTATAEPLLPHAGGTPQEVPHAGYFADAVRQELVQRFGEHETEEGGLIVHTSLDPRLQAAAESAVRNELEKYDHEYGGWHGLVAHVDDADLAADWKSDLEKQSNPLGMRHNWFLAIVISVSDKTARLGYIDSSAALDGTDSSELSAARTGIVSLDSIRWARPVVHGNLGGPPDSMHQVLHPGDFVMAAKLPKGGGALTLEQIPKLQGALICMDPRTGRVLAMVGGWSHDLSPYNRAIQAQRQPGSSVKPFVYLTAMEQNLQPDAPVLDAPFVQQMPNGTVYRPENYEDNFQGPVPIYHALEQSLNLATLHLARTVGLANVAKNFEAFGIVKKMPMYYPSAIGAIDTTLWKMVAGYAALDEYGRKITPSLIDSVTGPDGNVIYQAPNQSCDDCVRGNPAQPPHLDLSGPPLADAYSVFQDITMMEGVVKRGTGQPAVVGIKQPVAGKTGTTNDFNDAWFLGFTPGVLTGCWVGFDTPHSLGNNETGGNVCGPIWNQFMKVALANQPSISFPVPDGMTLLPTTWNGQTVMEAFKPGQTPGAQTNDSLLAGTTPSDTLATPASQPVAGNQPASPPAQAINKTLGGLY